MGRRNIVTFELRKRKDDDIRDALEQIPKQDRSEAIRNAIRAFLGLGGTNTLPEPLKRHTPASGGLEIGNITLARQEKSADEIADALDDLLKDF